MDEEISLSDISAYRKVRAYFVMMDAYAWCRDKGIECSEFLARNMASCILAAQEKPVFYWKEFEKAYSKCRDFML